MIFFMGIAAAAFLTFVYACLLAVLSKGLRSAKSHFSKWTPKVSVIVPAHNEETVLPDLLNRLTIQTYPKNKIDLLLVDDRSSDGTINVMRRFARSRSHCRILRITNTPEGISPKKHAIAAAVAAARGEICLTTDADSQPGTHWIRSMVRNYDAQTGVVIGYAPYRTDGPFDTFFHRLLALDYFSLAAVALASAGLGRPVTCNGANFSYRKDLFQAVGGFGETGRTLSGDDDLLLHRFHALAKCRIRYAVDPESAVFNNPPATFAGFFWQRIRFASKHLGYPKYALVFLFLVYLYYCALFTFMIGSFFHENCLTVFLVLLCVKAVFEVPFLIRAQRLLEKRNLVRFYPAAFLLHIVYVVFIPLLAQFLRPRWEKGSATAIS
jgi:cellulose synthase/poly-beta-1,6-N-acetylglucosamine synthase-like glycosyltransferase